MKILTDNQRRVLGIVEAAEVPHTVAEIAEATGLSVSSTRSALMALQRYEFVQTAGTAFTGGQCWAPRVEVQQ